MTAFSDGSQHHHNLRRSDLKVQKIIRAVNSLVKDLPGQFCHIASEITSDDRVDVSLVKLTHVMQQIHIWKRQNKSKGLRAKMKR
jgi:hypothetical protein